MAVREHLFDLTGKLAVVTGARRGIGQACAVALADAGADIIGASVSMEAQGSDVARLVESSGRTFTAHRVDFADRSAVTAFAADLAGLNRPIDILVNGAGTIFRAPAAEHSNEAWDLVLSVDLSSQFLLTREVGRSMVARKQGKIIFIASLLSYQGGVNVPSYAAAKHGVAGLTKAFANEWAPYHVNVNALAPGYVVTDSTAALMNDSRRSSAILDRIPAGRWGTVDDFAGPITFLASAASDYVHGTTLPVDGGWLAR